MQNRAPEPVGELYYSINYALTSIDDDDAYFHAQFRRANPHRSGCGNKPLEKFLVVI